ncbi:BSD domain-containing protein 1-like isoform X1 [Bacillus rossius redtenbacheri]|uniref:BSD domain-containing protein 1-like isoform X1 n=1 Tax=Bacillus rossius redtenbacheri TaxID=93214 RepID=UPI002FDD09EE
MAEEKERNTGTGWWDSWYKAAKDKSSEVYQFVKRDLDEFSSAVKCEASSVVSTTTTVLKDKLRLDEPTSTANTVKKSVSSFFDTVSNVLNPSPDDDDQEAIVIFDSQPVSLTKLQMKQRELVLNPDTFLADPAETHGKQFEAWLEIVEDQMGAERLSRLLAVSPDLHGQYTRLVPDQLSHSVFWHRYLFRRALLEDEEARREAAERRAEREKQAAENFRWDQGTVVAGGPAAGACTAVGGRGGYQGVRRSPKKVDWGKEVELSEEEQTRLLAEYEQECTARRLRGDPDDPLAGGQPCDDPLRVRERRDMVIVGDCHTSSSSGDKESNDDDWEREFDLEEGEADPAAAGKARPQ